MIKAAQKPTLELAQSTLKAHILLTVSLKTLRCGWLIMSSARRFAESMYWLSSRKLYSIICGDSIQFSISGNGLILFLPNNNYTRIHSRCRGITELEIRLRALKWRNRILNQTNSQMYHILPKCYDKRSQKSLKSEEGNSQNRTGMFEKWSLGVLSDCYLALKYALYRAENEDAGILFISWKRPKSDPLIPSFNVERYKRSHLSTCRHWIQLAIQSDGSGFTATWRTKLPSARQTLMSALRQSSSGLLGPCLQMYTSLA